MSPGCECEGFNEKAPGLLPWMLSVSGGKNKNARWQRTLLVIPSHSQDLFQPHLRAPGFSDIPSGTSNPNSPVQFCLPGTPPPPFLPSFWQIPVYLRIQARSSPVSPLTAMSPPQLGSCFCYPVHSMKSVLGWSVPILCPGRGRHTVFSIPFSSRRVQPTNWYTVGPWEPICGSVQ